MHSITGPKSQQLKQQFKKHQGYTEEDLWTNSRVCVGGLGICESFLQEWEVLAGAISLACLLSWPDA